MAPSVRLFTLLFAATFAFSLSILAYPTFDKRTVRVAKSIDYNHVDFCHGHKRGDIYFIRPDHPDTVLHIYTDWVLHYPTQLKNRLEKEQFHIVDLGSRASDCGWIRAGGTQDGTIHFGPRDGLDVEMEDGWLRSPTESTIALVEDIMEIERPYVEIVVMVFGIILVLLLPIGIRFCTIARVKQVRNDDELVQLDHNGKALPQSVGSNAAEAPDTIGEATASDIAVPQAKNTSDVAETSEQHVRQKRNVDTRDEVPVEGKDTQVALTAEEIETVEKGKGKGTRRDA
ncbi:MAG: hypothetical protein M1820_005068 [Bogoriella megaspora]|nr:MAG: hypothetical protein M1820_005068 [Bogoriella megaspora]